MRGQTAARPPKPTGPQMKDLIALLQPERRIEIVDVGAADLEHGQKPPYMPLVQAGAARVTGFEPNPDEFAKLPQTEPGFSGFSKATCQAG